MCLPRASPLRRGARITAQSSVHPSRFPNRGHCRKTRRTNDVYPLRIWLPLSSTTRRLLLLPRRKKSPQSAQRLQRKALQLARAGIRVTVASLLTHSSLLRLFSVTSVVPQTRDEILLGLRLLGRAVLLDRKIVELRLVPTRPNSCHAFLMGFISHARDRGAVYACLDGGALKDKSQVMPGFQ